MLIDDRQIRSIHVSKIIDLARVGITNSYRDLDDIPSEFPPEPHDHKLASLNNNGYMSKEDFKKLSELKAFKYLRVKNLDINNALDKVIEAKSYDDTISLTAGKNVVFKYDEKLNKLTISIDYTEEEMSITGPPGPPGDSGEDGFTWKPFVSSDGNLTFEEDDNPDPPSPVFIKGADGPQGERGLDALTPSWNNLPDKPMGNRGDVYYLKNTGDEVITRPPLIIGRFPINDTELNVYKNIPYDYTSVNNYWKKQNFVRNNQEPAIAFNNFWDISENGITATKKLLGYSMLMDYRLYEEFECEIEFYDFELTGCIGIICSANPYDGPIFNNISVVRSSSKRNYDFDTHDANFYNFVIAENFNSTNQNTLLKLNMPENKSSGRVKTKFKLIRNRVGFKLYYQDYIPCYQSYPDYSEAKRIDYTYENQLDPYGRNYTTQSSYGFGVFNTIVSKIKVSCNQDMNNKIYPIYGAKSTMYYNPHTNAWTDTGLTTSNDLGLGLFIKDKNTEKTYYISSDNTYQLIRNRSVINITSAATIIRNNFKYGNPIVKE